MEGRARNGVWAIMVRGVTSKAKAKGGCAREKTWQRKDSGSNWHVRQRYGQKRQEWAKCNGKSRGGCWQLARKGPGTIERRGKQLLPCFRAESGYSRAGSTPRRAAQALVASKSSNAAENGRGAMTTMTRWHAHGRWVSERRDLTSCTQTAWLRVA